MFLLWEKTSSLKYIILSSGFQTFCLEAFKRSALWFLINKNSALTFLYPSPHRKKKENATVLGYSDKQNVNLKLVDWGVSLGFSVN